MFSSPLTSDFPAINLSYNSSTVGSLPKISSIILNHFQPFDDAPGLASKRYVPFMFAIFLDKEADYFFIFAMSSFLDNYERKKIKKVHLPNVWKPPLSISSFSSNRERRIVA
jgi:hypothetical protein